MVASPNGTGHNDVYANSVISANDVWAVGVQTDASNYTKTLAEHWNGTSWTIVPTPNPGTTWNNLNGVAAISTNDVWAVGNYWDSGIGAWLEFTAHWDGSAWTVTVFNYGLFLAVTAVATNDVWVVGTTFFSPFQTVTEHWNGSSWTLATAANPGAYDNELFYVAAFSSTDVWAVGLQQASSSLPMQSLAEHWNGAFWSLITTPNDAGGSNSINAVVALEGGHAVGVGSGGFTSGVSPWHGEAWDLLASGTSTDSALVAPGTGDNVFEGLAISGSSVWGVGFWRATGSSARQTLAWPGTWNASTHTLTWGSMATSASPGSANSVLFAVAAVSPSVFWGVGYSNSGGYDASLVESYCGLRLGETAPASSLLGAGISVTVTAKNPDGTTSTGYRGTVHFSSTDTKAVLPSDYTFTAPDAGVHTFSGVVLNSPDLQTITATDAATPFISTSATVTAWCPGACPGPAGTPAPRGTNPTSSPGTPGSRTTRPAPGAAPAGPPGARVPRTEPSAVHLRPTGTNTTVPSTSRSAARAASPDARAYNVALPDASARQPTRAQDAFRRRLGDGAVANQDFAQGAVGALALLALVLVAVRRRNNRRLDASPGS